MMWDWSGFSWLFMSIGIIWMIVFWGAIIWLIVWSIKRLSQSGRTNDSSKTPYEILKERYARGEITREQFEQMKKDMNL